MLGPMRMVTSDPFGLFQLERPFPEQTPVVVYPPVVKLLQFPAATGDISGGDAQRRRTHYITTNAAGVRDYASGDSFNRIHWRSTARKGRLIVKEFELDPLSDVWIVLDADRTAHPRDRSSDQGTVTAHNEPAIPEERATTEEYAVTIAASLAQHFIEQNRAVGFSTHTDHHHLIQPDRGIRQLTKILETLAMLQAASTITFDQLLALEANTLQQGTTVITITPSTRETWVQAVESQARHGIHTISVLLDAESFGGRPGASLIAGKLRAAGAPVYRVRKGDRISVALSQPVVV